MDPILIAALATGAVCIVVIAARAFEAFRPDPAPKAQPTMITLPVDALASIEALAATPVVQAVLSDILAAIDAKLEASTADAGVRQLESLAFGVVVARLKSLATPVVPATS